MSSNTMFVVKRNGKRENVHFDKITSRIHKLCYGLDGAHVDAAMVSQKVIQGLYSGVTTTELDELAAQTAAACATRHPDFNTLAARICVSNLHKQTSKHFSDVIEELHAYVHPRSGLASPMVSDALLATTRAHKDRLNSAILSDRDYQYDYFGIKTLMHSYLFSLDGKVVERPQHMIMRVALGIHNDDIDAALETYAWMSNGYFTHATPTLYNAGTPRPQLSSCFLLAMKGDSIEGIYDTMKDCAIISKHAGGIGLSVHDIRATGSFIGGTNGISNGLVPMLRVFNNTARYVDQGGGKRKGSFAIYLEPWHADIFEFLELKKNHGNEMERARDLFYSLWVPDLFMKRVEENGQWSLFCPNEARGLADVWGEAFEKKYEEYEKAGLARKTIKAHDLWQAILASQTETGTPYILYKDACNRKSNQQNLGTIRSSNLCTEIIQYSSPTEIAVCNLASLSLPAFVAEGRFDFDKLREVTKVVIRNLNRVIDVNYYPVNEARVNNFRHRPVGLGVQGLADVFALLRFPFESEAASELNRDIFETMYFAALEASCDLAKEDGTYESYVGSPASKGILQPDMWGVTPSDRWDWTTLRAKIAVYGLRNSLLLAPMPTASTAQILGNNESFEPFTSNIFNRRVLAGEFAVVNKYLMRELLALGLWTTEIRNKIIADYGSVQNIDSIPSDVKDIFKTVWEIKQKTVIDLSAQRGAFICQSQSLNIHLADVSVAKLTSMHFYSWKKGLKTGMYYLRSKPKANAIQFTVEQPSREETNALAPSVQTCDEDVCVTCSA